MNSLDKDYQALLQDIIDNGVTKQDRTGTGTISVFGRQIRHNMKDGFPLLTTKKMPFKTIVTELLWFLRGDTNIKYLVDNNCHIWDGDTYKNYESNWLKENPPFAGPYTDPCLTQEEFINKIKTNDEFANKWGDLGRIYGSQWRKWEYHEGYGDTGQIDQIQNLINDLKTNPDSRRLMVNAWNVGELDQMVLPPCHYGFQVYTRELSREERYNLMPSITGHSEKNIETRKIINNCKGNIPGVSYHEEWLDSFSIPTRAISLMWNQRSVDTFLGLPFNIASYGLLLEIIAKEVNMVPDQLIGNLGDVHLYSNHIEQAKEQIGRELTWEERKDIAEKILDKREFEGYQREDGHWEGFGHITPFTDWAIHSWLDSKNIPKRTREPFKLPTLRFTTWINMVIKDGRDLDWILKETDAYTDCFVLENYQSHPAIKAPLSN